jgi:hypothetical protein
MKKTPANEFLMYVIYLLLAAFVLMVTLKLFKVITIFYLFKFI